MPIPKCLFENWHFIPPSKMFTNRTIISKAFFIIGFLLAAFSEVLGQQQQLQRQHFRASPKDQHVVEGQTSLIECEVGNQRGRVQWAKDGFVLGFNRSIPGYPRYEMVGDGEDGSHHLRIYNTTLVDDAAYQCQVGPADGHPPIRSTGRLTVLLPPSVVRLEGGGREDVIEVNEGDEITLECQVLNSKPVARVQWFKNDQAVKFDNRKDDVKESSLERRHDVISKITVKLTSLDDGSHYVCQADHQALDKPVKASIRISVLYPPGPPVITGYTEGENIRAGDTRVLSCRSRGGNPLGRVIWFRDNVEIDSTDQPVRGESVNEHRLVVEAKDNGAMFTCQVSNKLTKKPFRSSIALNVLFPPEKVQVSGPAQARVRENVTLTCFVENTNPPSTVSWVVDGKPNLLANTRNERAGGGGWHSVSTLAFHVPQVDRNIMFTCHATNEALGKTSVDTFLLSVLRPPQPPEIYGYSEGIGVRVGQEQSLSCVSRGGNPPAHLQWYRNGAKIPSEKHSVEEVSTAKITIQAEPHDNGAQFRCEAHNAAASTPVSVSTALVVFFPPQKVKVNVRPDHLHAGNQATITCEAGPSNPAVEISWLRGGFKMNGHQQEIKDTPNKGFIVTNVLVLNLTAADNDLVYSCQAMNTALQQKLQDSVTLHVRYTPQFLESPPEVVDVKIGDSLVLNLTARGNPEPVTYSWKHRGIPLPEAVMEENRIRDLDMTPGRQRHRISGPRVSSEGSVLRVQNVTIDDSGDYELDARNAQGATVAKVYLNVRYAAVIRETSGSVSASPGEDAVLECEAEGNPLSEAMMKWHRANYHFSRTEQTFGRKKAVLKLLRVTRNDTGVFTCVVDNGIGQSVSENISLIVNAKPIISRSKLLSQAAARLGSTGRLRCEAEGAPEVHFAWRKNGVFVPKNSYDSKFRNETFKIGLVTWASTLEVREVRERDFGYYDCVATNSLGSSTWSIQFTAPTKPKPPVSLKIVNSSHDSVTLEWTPGFDGGSTQYFRLRYRPKMGHASYEYVDVYEPNVNTHTVTGLQLDTEYYFSIMSRNEFGDSDYRAEFVRAITLSQPPPPPEEVLLNHLLEGRGHIPQIVIIVVAIVGTTIVIMNIALVICFCRRRRDRRTDDGSDLASSKSTTNTMYAPSSYNDTVVGETLSSISEKSRESSYNQEDSVGDYEEQSHHHKDVSSTYLINQIEPPPEYASQTPSSQPSSTAYDPHEDDYAEVLRRNAYNHQLGKGTPRLPSRATHYSTSPDSRGYISYSYTPSPTGLPNGGTQYHHHHHLELMPSVVGYGGMQIMDGTEHSLHSVLKNLDLDPNLPPPLELEQHSIPSEHPSLSLDPHSITIDHPLSGELPRNGDLRVQSTSLSTFNPNPSPTSYSESEMEGHLV